jgi:hypothetical protein
MNHRRPIRTLRRLATIAAALAALATTTSRNAAASAGCDAVNAGAMNWHSPGQRAPQKYPSWRLTVTDFAPGDVLKAVAPAFASIWQGFYFRLESGDGTIVVGDAKTVNYTVTGQKQDTTLTLAFGMDAESTTDMSVETTCTPKG